jgi:hypothetical protein
MANAVSGRVRLLTPPFRVSFPQVFEKASFNNGTPRYSLTALFFPKAFTDKDKEKWRTILTKLNEVALEAFKKSYKDLQKMQGYKLPFHPGNEKDYEGYGDADMRFCSLANSKRKPQIIDFRTGNPITSENAEEFYAGCWARASVNPYAFNNIGKGLALGLGNLQKLKDDKSFEGFTSAEDDFGDDDASDFVGDDFADDGLGGDGASGEDAGSDDDFS